MNNNRLCKLAILSPSPGQELRELREVTGVGYPRHKVAVAFDDHEEYIVTCDRAGHWSLGYGDTPEPGAHRITARTIAYGRGFTASVCFTVRGASDYLPLPLILEPEDCAIISSERITMIGIGTPGNRIVAKLRPNHIAEVTVGANGIWRLGFDGANEYGRKVASASEHDNAGHSSPEAWCEFWLV